MKRLIQFELRKIFSKRLTQTALLLLAFLSVLLAFSSYQNTYAFDGNGHEETGKTAVSIDKALAAKYEGVLTNEKVQQMMTDFAPKTNLHGLNAAYLYQNAMQSAVFARFADINGNWNGLSVSDVFGDEKINIGYSADWISTSQNMVRIFLVLSIVIIIMIAPVFCSEYSGVDQIVLTSKYGRTKCAAAKTIASMIAAFIVTLTVTLANFLLAFVLYGNDGLTCSVLWTPMPMIEGYIPFNITCKMLLAYQILLAFTGTISVAGITLLFSAISKNPMAATVAAAAAYFLPIILPVSETASLFRYVGLLPIYHAQFTSLMSIEQLSNSVLYALWTVPAAFIFSGIGSLVSCKIFAKHQVI